MAAQILLGAIQGLYKRTLARRETYEAAIVTMTQTTPSTDRRDFPRRDIRGAAIRAWVFTERKRLERCRVVEVSRKGILVKSSQMLRPGARVQIALAYRRGTNTTRLFRRWTRVTRRTANGFAAVFVTQRDYLARSRRNARV